MQRPIDASALQQRPPSGPINPNGGPTGPPTNGNGLHQVGNNGGVNANAAPGPIPATTPLVVRQDNNGVQWIAFEYSRDRVKMEYTIHAPANGVVTSTLFDVGDQAPESTQLLTFEPDLP